MVIVSVVEKVKTRIIRCPSCLSRICDLVIENDSHKIVTTGDNKCTFVLKCYKCKQLVGISVTPDKKCK